MATSEKPVSECFKKFSERHNLWHWRFYVISIFVCYILYTECKYTMLLLWIDVASYKNKLFSKNRLAQKASWKQEVLDITGKSRSHSFKWCIHKNFMTYPSEWKLWLNLVKNWAKQDFVCWYLGCFCSEVPDITPNSQQYTRDVVYKDTWYLRN